MPIITDFEIARQEDTLLIINLQPPAPVGGRNMDFVVQKYYGGISGLIVKSVSSGYNGLSGITVTDSGQGVVNIQIKAADTSGWNFGAYVFNFFACDSGYRTVFTEGYITVMPSVGYQCQ